MQESVRTESDSDSRIRDFSEFADEDPIYDWAEKIHVEDILGKPIEVHDYFATPSSRREGTLHARIGIIVEGEERSLFTGSQPIIQSVIRWEKMMPFTAIIRRKGRQSYRLTSAKEGE